MGQYLAIGIATQLTVSKEKAEKAKITLEEVLQKMQQTFHFSPDIYDFSEERGYWEWTLKKQIWEKELPGFLAAIYPMLYGNKQGRDFENVLKRLHEKPASGWMELAEFNSFTAFQLDKYGEDKYLYFEEKPFLPTLPVGFVAVALAMEGKIIMETYGTLFNFFARCIQETFPIFQLSKSVRVYITG